MNLTNEEIIGYSAGLISFFNMFRYMYAIKRDHIRPSLTYWGLAEVAMILIAISSWANGDRTTLWIAVAYASTQVIIIGMALRYGYDGMTRLDKSLFLLAFISVFLWWYTKNPFYTLVINVGIDAMSYIPLIRKSWKDPRSEDFTYWLIAAFASVLNMFAVTSLAFETVLYPWYLGIINLSVFLILFRRYLIK
jgi:uncharacterized membrane protein